jgi:integrase
MGVYWRGEKCDCGAKCKPAKGCRKDGVWWYEFIFQGQRIRESAKTRSHETAKRAERKRHYELEQGINRVVKRERIPLFPLAAGAWFESKTALTPLGRAYYRQYIGKLNREFGGRLISDITANDIAALQRKRQSEGLSGPQINCEVATLRAVLGFFGLWAGVAHRVKMLRERSDTGRSLSPEDERKLLEVIGQSPSPALYPFFILTLDAGLRPSETRALRRRDLSLAWSNGSIAEGEIIVGRSKTEAGTGRVIPLTRRACAALTLWLSRFSDTGPDAYVFPFHHVGFAGNDRKPHIWGIDHSRPMSGYSYKTAFNTARRKAGLDYRLYDARHTFVTRLAENPRVSEETIRQLAGHVSPRMLARYAHIRAQARRDAIATLEHPSAVQLADFENESPQNPPHSADSSETLPN